MQRSKSLPDFVGRGIVGDDDWDLLHLMPLDEREEAEQGWMIFLVQQGIGRSMEEQLRIRNGYYESLQLIGGIEKKGPKASEIASACRLGPFPCNPLWFPRRLPGRITEPVLPFQLVLALDSCGFLSERCKAVRSVDGWDSGPYPRGEMRETDTAALQK